MADVFLATPFDGGRHAARVAKIAALDAGAGREGGRGRLLLRTRVGGGDPFRSNRRQ